MNIIEAEITPQTIMIAANQRRARTRRRRSRAACRSRSAPARATSPRARRSRGRRPGRRRSAPCRAPLGWSPRTGRRRRRRRASRRTAPGRTAERVGQGRPGLLARPHELRRVEVEEPEPAFGGVLEGVLEALVVRELRAALACVDRCLDPGLVSEHDEAVEHRCGVRLALRLVDDVLDVVVGLARELALSRLLERLLGLVLVLRRDQPGRRLEVTTRIQAAREEARLVAQPWLDVVLERDPSVRLAQALL